MSRANDALDRIGAQARAHALSLTPEHRWAVLASCGSPYSGETEFTIWLPHRRGRHDRHRDEVNRAHPHRGLDTPEEIGRADVLVLHRDLPHAVPAGWASDSMRARRTETSPVSVEMQTIVA